ncbi:MAG TPA: ribonuclease III [Thermomicrobiales bacterium]|jgi:ribonuclease III|nr:ribonuclease III [Thermomicrobiales bacterium]
MTSSSQTAPLTLAYRLPDDAADAAFARNVGIAFRDHLILRLALTHRSILHDWGGIAELDAIFQSNERLEFLGDALLGLIVAEYLYVADPAADEGTLTRHRAATVRAETLVRWARELHMQDYLYLGSGERVTESARDRMLAGGFEALVGAIALDQGRDVAEQFVRAYLDRDLEAILASETLSNPKGILQEVMQERFGDPPTYETIAEEGPDHARQFTVAVVLEDRQIGVGKGRSKREAQQEAARQALLTLAQDDALAGDDGAPEGEEEPEASAGEPDLPSRDGEAVASAARSPFAMTMDAKDQERAASTPERPLAQRRVRGAGKREG